MFLSCVNIGKQQEKEPIRQLTAHVWGTLSVTGSNIFVLYSIFAVTEQNTNRQTDTCNNVISDDKNNFCPMICYAPCHCVI